MWTLLLAACWRAEPPPDHPVAQALMATYPSMGWRVDGREEVVGGARVRPDAQLVCTDCPASCVPLPLGPMVHEGNGWHPLETAPASESAVVLVQPMTAEVGLVRSMQVTSAPLVVPWPPSWQARATVDGTPRAVVRAGGWVVLDAPGAWELEGGGGPVPPMVTDEEHVVLTAEDLGLNWPPAPKMVRVTAPPGMSMSTAPRSRWDGGEVVAAYHHLDVRSEGRARWVGSAGDARDDSVLDGLPGDVARWPGLPAGPWTLYHRSGPHTVPHDKGLVVGDDRAAVASAWARRWLLGASPPSRLGHGWVDDGLLEAVDAWVRGARATEDAAPCLGPGSLPPARQGPWGARVLDDLEARHGRPWVLQHLEQAASPTWTSLLDRLPDDDRAVVKRALYPPPSVE